MQVLFQVQKDQILKFNTILKEIIIDEKWLESYKIEQLRKHLLYFFDNWKKKQFKDNGYLSYIILENIIMLDRFKNKSLLFKSLQNNKGVHKKLIMQGQIDLKISKIQIKLSKNILWKFIHKYVQKKQKQYQHCLNCQSKFPFIQMQKHMKFCKQKFDLQEQIEKVDQILNAKIQDLNTFITKLKILINQKEKQKQIKDSKNNKSKYFTFKINKNLNKTTYQIPNQFITCDDDSDSDISSTKSTSGPLRKINQLQLQQLCNYIKILQTIKIVGLKLKSSTEGKKFQIYNQLKNIKNSIKPKLQHFNVQQPQIDYLIRNLIVRIKLMQQFRKFQNGLNYQFNQYQNLKSQTYLKFRKLRDRKICQGSQNGYCSDQNSPNAQTKQKVSLKDFKIIRQIGKGKYGQVFLVVKKKTYMKYAMKRIFLQNSKDYIQNIAQQQNLTNQFTIFSIIDSPFLVKAIYSFNDSKYHYFVMEYLPNGDLAKFLQQQDRLFQPDSKLYLAQIAYGINYLHTIGIIHRDIKPQNIIIDNNGHMKIADYGLSQAGAMKRILQNQKNKTYSQFVLQQLNKKPVSKIEATRIIGSRYYMAPELLLGNQTTKMSDWWSYGVLVFHVLLGSPPFIAQNLQKMKQKIFQLQIWPKQIKFGNNTEQQISYQAKDLIQNLLIIDPNKRLGNNFKDIINHNFFKGVNWNNLLQTKPPFNFDKSQKQQKISSSQTDQNVKTSSLISGNKSLRKMIRRDLLNLQNKNYHNQKQLKYQKLKSFAQSLKKQQNY